MSLLAWTSSYLLRFNFDIPLEYFHSMILAMPVIIFLQILLFWFYGIHSAFWRFIGMVDLKNLIISIFLLTALISLTFFFLERGLYIPRSVLLLYALTFGFFACSMRIGYRYLKERRIFVPNNGFRKPVLVLGAGTAGEKLIRQLQGSPAWYVAGLLDDDPTKFGGNIHGVKVLGSMSDLEQVAKSREIRQVIMALPSVNHEVRRKVAASCKSAGVETLTVPAIDDLVSGAVSVSDIRSLELDDLLGRNPVHLDVQGLRDYVEGKTVLVTGAGGSIGSELCRQLARFSPGLLVLWELSEFALYSIETEFRDRYPEVNICPIIGDVKSKSRVSQTIQKFKPKIILHAAAYKHVPLMEKQNVSEAIKNNVYGTLNIARAAKLYGVENFILISTDKAVNPTSVMGASKRLAEMVCEFYKLPFGDSNTRFVVTRFGNVIGSTGSVIPRFQQQIRSGGPLTITHPDIKRYFMSISEAAQLVLQASISNYRGTIFVLDMGAPIKILDVARELIRLSGKTENEIDIIYTGLRDGEKLSEELLAEGEKLIDTEHPKLKIAQSRAVKQNLIAEIESWIATLETTEELMIKKQLSTWIPEYQSKN